MLKSKNKDETKLGYFISHRELDDHRICVEVQVRPHPVPHPEGAAVALELAGLGYFARAAVAEPVLMLAELQVARRGGPEVEQISEGKIFLFG